MNDVARKYIADNGLPKHGIGDRPRLEQEQDPARQILIRVPGSGDVVNKIVAADELTKGLGRPWTLDLEIVFKNITDPLRKDEVIRIGGTIYEEYPIEITRAAERHQPRATSVPFGSRPISNRRLARVLPLLVRRTSERRRRERAASFPHARVRRSTHVQRQRSTPTSRVWRW